MFPFASVRISESIPTPHRVAVLNQWSILIKPYFSSRYYLLEIQYLKLILVCCRGCRGLLILVKYRMTRLFRNFIRVRTRSQSELVLFPAMLEGNKVSPSAVQESNNGNVSWCFQPFLSGCASWELNFTTSAFDSVNSLSCTAFCCYSCANGRALTLSQLNSGKSHSRSPSSSRRTRWTSPCPPLWAGTPELIRWIISVLLPLFSRRFSTRLTTNGCASGTLWRHLISLIANSITTNWDKFCWFWILPYSGKCI